MKKDILPNKETITIKIDIPTTIYECIKEQAKAQKISLKEYCCMRLTDDLKGAEEIRRDIMKSFPAYYNSVNQVGDRKLQQYLSDFVGYLCRL